MAYRAFVVGADYDKLKFAVADARRIANTLQTLGYELPEPLIPRPEEDNTAIAARFTKFATECKSEDTLLFYFSGHGLLDNGLLFLLLETYDPARNPLQTCLTANDLSTAFQASNARNKLMILDCCHAGVAFPLADFVFSENYFLLTASESFEKALELENLQAGFLSHHLHNALTKDLAKVIQDSRVGLDNLQAYLRRQVVEQNRTSHKVPQITVVSKQKRDMVLAELADPYLNLSGLVCVNPAFLATERAKTGPRYTPENFYGALPPVQWWGVANGLVAEQSLYLPVEQHVRQAVHAYPPVIAVLHGSGGMGKSVLLRRLGANLVGELDVWWLDDPQTLLEEQEDAQSKLLERGRPQLILIDDWSALDQDTRKTLRAWFEQLAKSGKGQYLKFVLTSRYWKAEELPLKLVYANSLFDFDKLGNLAQDNPLLLDNAVAQLGGPGLGEAARELRTPQMAQTKPFHLLFVLMRLAEDTRLRAKLIAERGKTLSFEHIFQDIFQDDLDNLWRDPYKKGLAAAVSMAAYLHIQYRPYLGKTALLKLADHYNPHYPLPSASQPADWGTIKYYMYTYQNPISKRKDPEDFVAFIKDEFAESLIAADSRGHRHVENRCVPDLEFLVREADFYTSSYLFYNVCQFTPTLWNAEIKQALICHLMDRKNGHHAYAWMLLHDGLFDNETRRWELISRYLDIAPTNYRFVVRFLKWANKHADKLKLFARQLLQQAEQSLHVVCTALSLLNRDDAWPFARKLFEQPGQAPEVICTALGVLDTDGARPFARKLLEKPGQALEVICTALGLLNRDDARPFARKLLEQPGQAPEVICTALGVLDTDGARPFCQKTPRKAGASSRSYLHGPGPARQGSRRLCFAYFE